jgi:hypothetical protein
MGFIAKVKKRLRFEYFLTKKAAQQKFSAATKTYLNSRESTLKDLLVKKNVGKDQTQQYFNSLSDSLHDNLVNSGISYRDFCDLISAKLTYSRSGFTPDKVQQILVDSYCKTNGLFQEVMFDFLYRDHKQDLLPAEKTSIFGNVDRLTIDKTIQEVRDTGYSVLPFKLPKDLIDKIVGWSKDLTYTIIDDSLSGKYPKAKVDFSNMPYTKASASEDDLKSNETIMKICQDPVLATILQSVLQAPVDLWHLSMWWSFKTGKASSEAAQVFHYDLDTVRWLKVFVYLTDVGPNNGPHIAIPGSHQLGGKNYQLLRKRYDRISDEEIAAKQVGEVTEFQGAAGTIIIGDTRCWHKGKEVLEGNRLILQPTFSPTLFLKKLV